MQALIRKRHILDYGHNSSTPGAGWRDGAASLANERPDAMNDLTSKPDDFVDLYRRAFSEYGTQALWNMQAAENPTPADALAITLALRIRGGMDGRRLAETIERLCHAPH